MAHKPGLYWNRKTWEITPISGKEREPALTDYVRLSTFLALLLAPILGATLVLFLPFAGIALFLREGLLRVGLKKVRPARA